MKVKRLARLLVALMLSTVLFVPALMTVASAATYTANGVYHIPIHEEVEKGLYAFLQRAFKEAEENQADAIILDINTPGGFTSAAGQIAMLMERTDIRTIAYINKDALSAGAFLALHADEIYMAPNATMGAAAVIDQSGNAADKKAQSAWLKQMKAAAESSGRNPKYAMAMADATMHLPKYGAPKGELLTLSPSEALEVGYSQGTMATLGDVLKATKLDGREIIEVTPTFFENVARFITNPVIVPILLSIASLGLVLELYSPGFGVPGTMGVTAIGLFFFGHLVAGFAGYESLLLLVLGIALIGAEFFIPGGIIGMIGTVMVIASLLTAGEDVTHMMLSIVVAGIVAIIGMVVIMKVFGKKLSMLNRLVLKDATTTEDGYVSNVNRIDLIGRIGKTETPLRPAGVVNIQDERLDVVSEGAYVDANELVEVIKVEGSRIVVRKTKEA
ncbi:membrane protein [Lysinibacillus sp. BF-4]|nr:membrane protein [Lysinibacillus sp. BF-4]